MRLPARIAAIERAVSVVRRRPLLLWLDWRDDAVQLDGSTFTLAEGESLDELAHRAIASTRAAHPDREVIVYSWERT